MNTKQKEKQSPKDAQIRKKNRVKNSIGCLIILLIGGFYFTAYFPGFLAYRNKLKCYDAESDAKAIADYLNDYFTDHDLITISSVEQLINQQNITLSGKNTATFSITDPNGHIVIEVTDGSGRCPVIYQGVTTGWDGNYVYKLTISND